MLKCAERLSNTSATVILRGQSRPVREAVTVGFVHTYAFDSFQVPFEQRVQGEDHVVAQTLELEGKAETGKSKRDGHTEQGDRLVPASGSHRRRHNRPLYSSRVENY